MSCKRTVMVAIRSAHNTAGGVERVSIWLVNTLVEQGFQALFFSWDDIDGEAFYPISKQVTWVKFNSGSPLQRANIRTRISRFFKFRKLLRQHKIGQIVAFQQGVTMALAVYSLGMPVRIIGCLRNSLSIFKFTRAKWGGLLQKYSFGLANEIVVQFPSYKSQLPSILHKRVTVIPNPFLLNDIRVLGDIRDHDFLIVSVGRLSFQKDYPVLIMAIKILVTRGLKVRLKIIGGGEQFGALQELIHEQALNEHVILAGPLKEPCRFLSGAHLFCHTALWEGFPNAVGEALAVGLPVVGFRDCDGLNELVQHGKNGLLADVRTSVCLADVISDYFSDLDRIQFLSKGAIESMKIYEEGVVKTQWLKLLESRFES